MMTVNNIRELSNLPPPNLPNPDYWTDKMFNRLVMDSYKTYIDGAYRYLKLERNGQKSKRAEEISELMSILCSLMMHQFHSTVRDYFEYFEIWFPKINSYIEAVTVSWTNRKRLTPLESIETCNQMTVIIDKLSMLCVDLNEYNQKRRDVGLADVGMVDQDCFNVLASWEYRLDGGKYRENE